MKSILNPSKVDIIDKEIFKEIIYKYQNENIDIICSICKRELNIADISSIYIHNNKPYFLCNTNNCIGINDEALNGA